MLEVSIIVPVYNKGTFLKRTIESILNQTYPNFELILINDGSTDNSKQVILNYLKQENRIKYIEQENEGVSSARNKGIEYSNGEYISFLDADDKLSPYFLEKMINKIKETNTNVCYCGHYEVINHKIKKGRINFNEGDILQNYIYNRSTPNTNSWLINKKIIKKYNIKFNCNFNWGEDMEFFSKVLLHEKNVKCVKEYLTYYEKNIPNSLSSNNVDKIQKDISWMEELKKYINEVEQDNKRKELIISAIDTYRLPAAIIYRLYNNRNLIGKLELENLLNYYKKYIENIKFSNGIRSIKLAWVYYKLKSHLNHTK